MCPELGARPVGSDFEPDRVESLKLREAVRSADEQQTSTRCDSLPGGIEEFGPSAADEQNKVEGLVGQAVAPIDGGSVAVSRFQVSAAFERIGERVGGNDMPPGRGQGDRVAPRAAADVEGTSHAPDLLDPRVGLPKPVSRTRCRIFPRVRFDVSDLGEASAPTQMVCDGLRAVAGDVEQHVGGRELVHPIGEFRNIHPTLDQQRLGQKGMPERREWHLRFIVADNPRMTCEERVNATLAKLDDAEARVKAIFEGMSDEVFNRPGPPSNWSPAMILDHLLIVDDPYLGKLAALTDLPAGGGEPVRYTWLGKFLMNAGGPGGNAPAPKSMTPKSGPRDREIVERYLAHLAEARRQAERLRGVDLNRVRINNPFMPIFRMTAGDVLGLMDTHKERHIQQIEAMLRG